MDAEKSKKTTKKRAPRVNPALKAPLGQDHETIIKKIRIAEFGDAGHCPVADDIENLVSASENLLEAPDSKDYLISCGNDIEYHRKKIAEFLSDCLLNLDYESIQDVAEIMRRSVNQDIQDPDRKKVLTHLLLNSSNPDLSKVEASRLMKSQKIDPGDESKRAVLNRALKEMKIKTQNS